MVLNKIRLDICINQVALTGNITVNIKNHSMTPPSSPETHPEPELAQRRSGEGQAQEEHGLALGLQPRDLAQDGPQPGQPEHRRVGQRVQVGLGHSAPSPAAPHGRELFGRPAK